jgi:hypothetical protein
MIREPNQFDDPQRGTAVTGGARVATRRGWLQCALGVMGGLIVKWPQALRNPPSAATALESWLEQTGFTALGGRLVLARIGALYLASHPRERDRVLLARLLVAEGTLPARQALAAAIGRDWYAHDVEVIDGWVMARAEARICALAHLSGVVRA